MTSKHKQVPQLHSFLNTLQHTIHSDRHSRYLISESAQTPRASPKRAFRGGGEIRVNSPGAASRPAAATPGTAPPLSPPPVCQCCRADRARTARSNISAHCRSGKWRSLLCPRRIPDPSPSASSRRRGVQTYGLSVALWRREARPLCGALVQAHINRWRLAESLSVPHPTAQRRHTTTQNPHCTQQVKCLVIISALYWIITLILNFIFKIHYRF